VAPEFGFVADASEGDAVEGAAHAFGDAASDSGFSDSGRSDKAENLGGAFATELADGEFVKDSLFDFFEAAVVFVEEGAGVFEIESVFGAVLPGEIEEGVEVVAEDGAFGGGGRGAGEPFDLLVDFFEERGLEIEGEEPFAVDVGFALFGVNIVEFSLDEAHLLSEENFALGIADFAFDFGAETGLELEDFGFVGEVSDEGAEAFDGVRFFEEGLTDGEFEGDVLGDEVGEFVGGVGGAGLFGDFGGDVEAELDGFFEGGETFAQGGLGFSGFVNGDGERGEVGAKGAVFAADFGELDAFESAEGDAAGAIGHGEDVEDFGEGSDAVEVGFGGGFDRVFALGDDEDAGIGAEGFIEGLDGAFASDEYGLDEAREQTEGAHGERVLAGFCLRGVAHGLGFVGLVFGAEGADGGFERIIRADCLSEDAIEENKQFLHCL